MYHFKAAVLKQPGTIAIEQVTKPDLELWQALVRIRFAGICGTDLAIFSGSYPVQLPLVPGHEFVGVVVKVGDPVAASHLVGKPVVGEINNSCRVCEQPLCEACKVGLPNHCLSRTVVGIDRSDGAFAELIIIPWRNLHVMPNEIVPPEIGVFIEPLAAAIRTFELSSIQPGQLTLILGAGRLGILAALVAARIGAETIIADPHPEKLSLAGNLIGNIRTIQVNDKRQLVDDIHTLTGGLGADIVVEATGNPDSLESALRLVRPRGTIAIKSTPGTPIERFDLTGAVVNEITIQGSRCGPFHKAISFITQHQPALEKIISAVIPLSAIESAFQQATVTSKIIINCE